MIVYTEHQSVVCYTGSEKKPPNLGSEKMRHGRLNQFWMNIQLSVRLANTSPTFTVKQAGHSEYHHKC